jgi:hypothetical protein
MPVAWRQGWKISPSIRIAAGETREIANIDGMGAIQQIWLTPTGNFRLQIIRIYWDDQVNPSVECPLGDFLLSGWGKYAQLSSLAVCVNPGSAFNCYWEMPFRKRCRITVSNISDKEVTLYYQINYTLTDVPADCAYFHAQYRRHNPLPYATDHTILDGVIGHRSYVRHLHRLGRQQLWLVGRKARLSFLWMVMVDSPRFVGLAPKITFVDRTTLTSVPANGGYREFTTPYAGLSQVIRPDGTYQSQTRFGMYRWHIMDPIRFQQDLRVTIQALGWRSDGRYLPLQDDISSVAYWYRNVTEPAIPRFARPRLSRDYLAQYHRMWGLSTTAPHIFYTENGTIMQRIALTTWSIHPYLSDGSLDLLAVPARIKEAGIATVEICHFHIPSTDDAYLQALKTAAADAGRDL